ncbi:MAG: response regulator, partial [Bacteroidota bacterium]
MPPFKNKKILVVEDVNNIEIDVRNRLEEMGYMVQSIVLSAEKAFESIENETPDLVLMDIKLDGKINGIEAARQIQDNYSVPVVFLSGENDKKLLRETVEAGAFGFVSKPFKEAEI